MKIKNQVKTVKETNSAKNISCYLVVNKKGAEVATIHCYHSATIHGFVVRVDVYQPIKDGFAQYRGRSIANALHGGEIAGVKLYDGSETDADSEKMLAEYRAGNKTMQAYIVQQAVSQGMCFTNTDGDNLFTGLYYMEGLERLHSFGYIVHRVL
jgi:hypothetical protein